MKYFEAEIDFLAVYLAPEKLWCILPYAALRVRKNLTLHAAAGGVDGEYLERWALLWGDALGCTSPGAGVRV